MVASIDRTQVLTFRVRARQLAGTGGRLAAAARAAGAEPAERLAAYRQTRLARVALSG